MVIELVITNIIMHPTSQRDLKTLQQIIEGVAKLVKNGFSCGFVFEKTAEEYEVHGSADCKDVIRAHVSDIRSNLGNLQPIQLSEPLPQPPRCIGKMAFPDLKKYIRSMIKNQLKVVTLSILTLVKGLHGG